MDDFKQLAKIFKKSFPEYKINIRRTKISRKSFGDCCCLNKAKKHFLIRIDKSGEIQEQILILIHEMAHVIAWDDPDDHGKPWGKAYSTVYNIYLDEFVNGSDQ